MPGPTPEISPRAFADRLARGESFAVLDVREPAERLRAAIPLPETAVDIHVPMGAVPSSLEAIRAACGGRPTVVYCHHGVRSGMVVDWLARQGLCDLLNLEGGIDAWSLAVDPGVPRY